MRGVVARRVVSVVEAFTVVSVQASMPSEIDRVEQSLLSAVKEL